MRRTIGAVLAVGALCLAGCGGTESAEEAAAPTTTALATTTTAPTTTAPPTTTEPPAPSYRTLSDEELAAALLALPDVPPGYSEDPPEPEGDEKTFCDYRPPFEQQTRVRRDFTKGGGVSAEVLSVGMRQYASPEEAAASFDALTTALDTCPGEAYAGSQLTYSAMSAPELGDAAVGVKISADGTDLLQFFVLVGPTLVNTGGGGLMNANADEVTAMLEAQVAKYEASARG